MQNRRTDLAVEAHALWCAAANNAQLEGVSCKTYPRGSFSVTEVCVETAQAAKTLNKPRGHYITIDLRRADTLSCRAVDKAAVTLSGELRTLLPERMERALVIGLGNRAMTPDAIGPKSTEHIPATRHLMREKAFGALKAVSLLTPNVLGRTGMESAELVSGAVKAVRPDTVIAVDALCAQRLGRVCTTIQLSDTGIVPGSGVGNHRRALTRETLGVPVIAVGVPTVVDAATLTLDLLEEVGIGSFDPETLHGHTGMTVTPRDIDAQVETLSHIVGFGISLALQPALSLHTLRELL